MPAIPRQHGSLVASTPSPLKRLPQELAGLLLGAGRAPQELVKLHKSWPWLPRLPVRLASVEAVWEPARPAIQRQRGNFIASTLSPLKRLPKS